MQPGEFVVGGSKFGLGSSREHAPTIIKMAVVCAVLAKSFARIFFRNAINVGLPVLICDTDQIAPNDELEVDLSSGRIYNITQGKVLQAPALPEVMIRLLADGGLAAHVAKHGDLVVE